jgi:c-di-GMP-binding flagellar brake protein YcgR
MQVESIPSYWREETKDQPHVRYERRAHPRLSCKGIAKFLILPDGPQVTGNLINLSLGGCCVECDKEIQARYGTPLDVMLDACDLRVRLSAEICRIEENRVGIRFLEMSPRKEGQIHFLIEELFEFSKQRIGVDGKDADGD